MPKFLLFTAMVFSLGFVPRSSSAIVRTLREEGDTAKDTATSNLREARGGLRDGSKDFDFFVGDWKVHNRRLKHPLDDSTEWIEFDGTSVSKQLWTGKGNMDEVEFDSPTGHIEGLTVRLYNPASKQWSLYWSNSSSGTFDQALVGEFKNGRGEFFDHEPFKGRQISVRFVWSNITDKSCHWEQAFSQDGGKTWETNWTMDFVRQR